VLAPILAWFSEGFETRDLVEAQTLLAKLFVPTLTIGSCRALRDPTL
jgi:hypothetical protein